MTWLFLWLALALGTQIWLCFRVGRSSVALAIATFFIGPVGAVYTLFKHRGDDETSVTVPFVANLVFSVLFLVTAWQVVVPMLEAQELEEMGGGRAAVAVATSTEASDPPHAMVAAAPAASAVASEPAASAAEPAAASASAADAVDAFSQALRAAGLAHTVTRLPASTALPPGVTDAALFAVAPMGSAASASQAASASGAGQAGELSVTLFRCDSANACRNLAGAHMQQEGPNKRRVLQNGLLLLSTPPAAADDGDLTPAAVASTFRKLQP